MDITNTTRKENHFEWCIGGNPRAIEDQEARGQQQLVESPQLPTDCRGDIRKALEAAGVLFGPPMEDDPIFCRATLPAGWKKRATEHSMWSELVDQDGEVRAAIFYKAAFYDRSAFMRQP